VADTLYVVDTDALIDVERGFSPTIAFLDEVISRARVCVSVVTLAEFYSARRPGERPRLDAVVATFEAVPVSAEIALLAAAYRRTWRAQGRPLAIADCLIAATAEALDATLVTRNARDFPMPSVRVTPPEL
jgi:tRNA(fMet)-specific endonuclease VapC